MHSVLTDGEHSLLLAIKQSAGHCADGLIKRALQRVWEKKRNCWKGLVYSAQIRGFLLRGGLKLDEEQKKIHLPHLTLHVKLDIHDDHTKGEWWPDPVKMVKITVIYFFFGSPHRKLNDSY